MPISTRNAPVDIMIVDDNPVNLKLLEGMLRQKGHEVRSFPLGRLALAAAAARCPDLILLDINMPEMDGYQVCERLKSSPDLSAVPVIFLSALTETEDKIKAFRSGAVDYISKPFQFEEVDARVETHLDLYRLQRALSAENQKLEAAVAARTKELAEANERLTSLDKLKNQLLALISHEFRTPLNGLLGVGSLILESTPPNESNERLKSLYERSRRNILSILDDALLLAQLDANSGNFTAAGCSVSSIASHAVEQTNEFAHSRQVTLSYPRTDLGTTIGNQVLLTRAVGALLETAVKFSTKDQFVSLWRENAHGFHKLIIESRGRAIPQEFLPPFFDLFAITEAITPGGDLGVSAPLALRILSLYGGSVSVENCDPPGVRFTILLKTDSPPT